MGLLRSARNETQQNCARDCFAALAMTFAVLAMTCT